MLRYLLLEVNYPKWGKTDIIFFLLVVCLIIALIIVLGIFVNRPSKNQYERIDYDDENLMVNYPIEEIADDFYTNKYLDIKKKKD